MKTVSIKTTPPVAPTVEEVTITLSKTEVEQIVADLNYAGSYSTANEFSRLLLAPTTDPNVWYNSGHGDSFLYDSKVIQGIKECRAATGCGLKEAKDASDARKKSLGLW